MLLKRNLLMLAMMTVNSNVHGHGAYTIVCEIFRVDGLLAQLNQ